MVLLGIRGYFFGITEFFMVLLGISWCFYDIIGYSQYFLEFVGNFGIAEYFWELLAPPLWMSSPCSCMEDISDPQSLNIPNLNRIRF